MEINGIRLEFSLLDPGDMERYCVAGRRLTDRREALEKTGPAPGLEGYTAQLRECCGMLLDYFDDIFGEGTSNRLFGEKTDLGRCLAAYRAFETTAAAQAQAIVDKLRSYAPNRAVGRRTTNEDAGSGRR